MTVFGLLLVVVLVIFAGCTLADSITYRRAMRELVSGAAGDLPHPLDRGV